MRRERSYPYAGFIGTLFLFNVLCLADRQILGAVIEPLKSDLRLSDTAIGLLAGLAFSVVYSTLGLPIARLADRASRRLIIGAAFITWSAMTAFCGFAVSYWDLLLARFGVALGEAGFGPAAHAMIAHAVPLKKRTSALSIFALGSTVGVVVGLSLGGVVAERFGWRSAFLVLGVFGLALSGLVSFLPPNRATSERRDAMSVKDTLSTLTATRAYWPLILAAAAHLFVSYGMTWNIAFLMRSHGMSLSEAGLWSGALMGFCGGFGTIFGGWLGDLLSPKRPDALPLIGCASVLISIPFALMFYLSPSLIVVLTSLAILNVLNTIYQAPTYAAVQLLAGDHQRATAAAVMIFVQNLVGMGLGPLFVGALSDSLVESLGRDSLRWSLAATFFVNGISAVLYLATAGRMRAWALRAAQPDRLNPLTGGGLV